MKGKLIVVGGGLAGLMATIKAAEAGVNVELFSLVPVKRSHSVCAQGGINGAVNTKGEGDSPWIHFDDTIYGGDFLANQPPVKAMCEVKTWYHSFNGPYGCYVQPYGRRTLISVDLVERNITVQHLLVQQLDSNYFTH